MNSSISRTFALLALLETTALTCIAYVALQAAGSTTIGPPGQIGTLQLGTGSQQGLVLTTLSDGLSGHLCLLDNTSVADAVCAALLGRPKDVWASVSLFTGSPSTRVVAAINGCPHYKDNQNSSNLNNDCRVITGPSIPVICASRPMAVRCSLVELRHGPSPSEGLAVVKFDGIVGSVCASGVGMIEAIAICRSLGSPSPGRAVPLLGRYDNLGYENATIEALQCSAGASLDSCTWRTVASPACALTTNRLGVLCASDPVTPRPQPSPSLLCYRQQANICFHAASLTGPADLELADSSNSTACSPTNSSSGTHVCLVVQSYQACSVNSTDLGDLTEHHLRLLYKGERGAGGNYVRPPLVFNLFCQVGKEALATGASLAPEFATPTTARDGHIGGQAVIELYRDLANGSLSDQLLGSVDVGTIIYAAVVLKNAIANSWLVVNDCWAQEGASRANLVVRKCPATPDIAIIPVNSTVIAVRFQAFVFNGSSSSGSRINLICSTVTCRQGDPSVDCSRACGTFAVVANYRKRDHLPAAHSDDLRERQLTPPAQLTVRRGGGVPKAASRLRPTSAPVALVGLAAPALLVAAAAAAALGAV